MRAKNLQVIYVMWLREMKIFLRAKSRWISNLALPFFFLFTMAFGFRRFRIAGVFHGMSYGNFLVPGIIGMTMLFSSMFTGISILWDRDFGFLKEIMVAPVKRSAVILGRVSGGVTNNLIQGISILLSSFLIGFRINSLLSIFWALLFMVVISVGFNGLSVAIASKMRDPQAFPLIMHFFTYPAFLFSGALFPIADLPFWLRSFSYLDPLTYGVDGLRGVLVGFSQFPPILDLSVLLIFSLAMVILGSWLFSRTEV
ncbi:ABC transporter permease [bacterium]|nr:ABC transporter permease [bacterium]